MPGDLLEESDNKAADDRPGSDVIPPTTAAARPRRKRLLEPKPGVKTPIVGSTNSAAIAPRPAPVPQTNEDTRAVRTPTRRTVIGSSDAASTPSPKSVRLRNSASPPARTTVTTRPIICVGLTNAPKTSTPMPPTGPRRLRGVALNSWYSPATRKLSRPTVAIVTATRPALTIRRTTSRSNARPMRTANAIAAIAATGHGHECSVAIHHAANSAAVPISP